MAKEDFMKYVAERQAKQREQKDKEVGGYFRESYTKKRCSWGIKFGGYKR